MRKEYEMILAKELRLLAIETRERLNLTQREMSSRLQMSESSYSDIETGRYNCSMASAILLLNLQEDPTLFIRRCVRKALRIVEREVQTV
jgi:DNA-binding XRE family transcriptional regulator